MNTKPKEYQRSVLSIACPCCKEKTSIKAVNDFKPFYASCSHCKEKFVVEPVRDGIKVFTLGQVPYSSDPDCQALEMGQGDEE